MHRLRSRRQEVEMLAEHAEDRPRCDRHLLRVQHRAGDALAYDELGVLTGFDALLGRELRQRSIEAGLLVRVRPLRRPVECDAAAVRL